MNKLEEINFHDKIVLDIKFESNEDFLDSIFITILDGKKKYLLQCKKCVKIEFDGNGWISGRDSIREFILEQGKEIWDNVPSFIPEQIRKQFVCLKLNFNVSNSKLKLIVQEIGIVEQE